MNTLKKALYTSIIFRLFSVLLAICFFSLPLMAGYPVEAGPPPGSLAATTFTNATTPPAPASTTTTTTTETTAITDKFNYEHGETAAINGAGFTPGSDVNITVTTPEGTTTQWTVKADASGSVSTSYTFGNGADGLFTAVLSDGKLSATTVFTDPAVVLTPNGDILTELNEQGSGSSHWTKVDDTLPGHDGNSTYVYNYDNHWHTDLYTFTDLPDGYDLGGGSGSDTTAPNTPSPSSTTHTTNTWSNNPNITMVWSSVTDPGGTATGASVQIVTVAKATTDGGGCGGPGGPPDEPDGQIKFAVVKSVTWHEGYWAHYHWHPGYYTYDYQTYNPDNPPGTQLDGDWQTYTYTLTQDANGNDWTVASINALIAGIQLRNEGSGDARDTQLYLVVTPGSSGSSGVAGYNYYWDTKPPTTYTTGTTVYSILSDGAHNFYVNAQDNCGNTSAYGTSGQYLIDTKAPTLDKLIDGIAHKNGWYNLTDVGSDNKLDITLTANDTNGTTPVSGVSYIVYQVGAGPSTTVNNPSTTGAIGNGKSATQTTTFVIQTLSGSTAINQGALTLQHSTADVAGNTYTLPTQTVLIDTQNPLLIKNLTGTMGNSNWYTSSSVGVQLDASDPTPGSGVDTIQYSVNGGGTTTATNTIWADANSKSSTFSTSTTVNTQGVNTISHVAYDVAGNSSANNPASTTTPQTIKIDSASPLLTKNLSGTTGENGWFTSTVGVQLDASDPTPGSGIDSINYNINNNPVTTVVVNPTVIDATNNVKSSTFSTSTTISTEGINTISHTTYDVAGNSSANNPGSAVSPQTVKIDSVAPGLVKTINGAAPRDNTVNNGWYNAADAPGGVLTVALNSSDATSGVQSITYSQGAGIPTTVTNPTPGSNTYSTSFNLTNQGTTPLTHSTKDMAGNTYVLTAQDVKLDTIIPTLVKSIARTGLDQVTVTLSGADDTSGSGINNIVYSQDGGTAVTVLGGGIFSKDTTFVITGIGAHDLTHNITDIAGNQFVLADQSVAIGENSAAGLNVPNTPIPVITFSLQNGPIASRPVTPIGMLLSDADVTSPDGLVTINVPAGTTVLNSDGTPTYLNKDPDVFSIASVATEAPAGYQMISSYELSPSGVTFDSPITLGINYDPDKLPSGTQPVIAFFDEGSSKWIDLETAGYIAADGTELSHTAAARVSHFTRFAVLAK